MYSRNQRCNCLYRTAFLFQCAHEYAVDKEFIITKYSKRWYNRKSCNSLVIGNTSDQVIEEFTIETNDQFDLTQEENNVSSMANSATVEGIVNNEVITLLN